MRIKAGIEKVPGGMMLVPLLIGAVIHTAAPDAGKFFGSFTGALFTGLPPILGVFYVCLGATLDLKATPYIATKGGALLGSKIVFAAASPSNEARNGDPALPTLSNVRSIVSDGVGVAKEAEWCVALA